MPFGAIAGGLIGGAFGLGGALLQNSASASAARDQMRFQERMFKNRYQYQMADMRAAGLNPMLSYSSSPPAAPAGAMYQPVNVAEPAQKGIETAVTSGLAAFRLKSEVQKMEAETKKAQADAVKAEADAGLTRQQTKSEPIRRWLMESQADQASSAADLTDQNRKVRQIEEQTAWKTLEIADKEAIIAGIEAGFYKTGPGEVAKVLEKMGVKGKDALTLGKSLWMLLRR